MISTARAKFELTLKKLSHTICRSLRRWRVKFGLSQWFGQFDFVLFFFLCEVLIFFLFGLQYFPAKLRWWNFYIYIWDNWGVGVFKVKGLLGICSARNLFIIFYQGIHKIISDHTVIVVLLSYFFFILGYKYCTSILWCNYLLLINDKLIILRYYVATCMWLW